MFSRAAAAAAPTIIAIAAAIFLFAARKYRVLFGFAVTYWMNYNLVIALKNWIREPRPAGAPVAEFSGAHIYGMPSGHSMESFFTAGFMVYWLKSWDSLRQPWMWMTAAIILAAVLWQRWFYKYHTPAQLLAGVVAGVVVGAAAARVTDYVITKVSNSQDLKENILTNL